jgi:thiol-disulfide isomerase/thioredoxin
MAYGQKPKPTVPSARVHGVFLETRTIVGGAVALLGVGMLALFLWMVPSAATREVHAACAGLKPKMPNASSQDERARGLAQALCRGNANCQYPLPAPDFTALDITGKPVRLSDFRGKVVLLNFWASWCGVCETEKPLISRMAKDLAGEEFVVVALASDRSWTDAILAIVKSLAPEVPLPFAPPGQQIPFQKVKEAYEQATDGKGLSFVVLLDRPQGDDNIGQIAASWGIHAVPESALIDRDGNVRAYFDNKRDWESPVAETCLRSMIDGRDGTD